MFVRVVQRLIRDVSTGKFLTPGGTWSEDTASALNFSDIAVAIAARDKFDLRHVEYVLIFEERPSSYDVAVPLRQRNR
jgi:hypothetical protein